MTLHALRFFVVTLLLLGCLLGCSRDLPQKTPVPLTDSRKAEQLFNRIKADPNDVASHIELGRMYLSEGRIDAATRRFEKVLSIDSRQIQAYLLLSLALQKHVKPDLPRAAALLEKAAKIAPQDAEVHLNLAQVYAKLNMLEKAISEFESAIELSDDEAILVSGHLGLMAIYKKRGELGKAGEEYKTACELYPGVKDMIMESEIALVTPAPKYAGENVDSEGSFHPSLESRIKQAQDAIAKIREKKDD